VAVYFPADADSEKQTGAFITKNNKWLKLELKM
jgi:hypothetical protein